jgi:tellurite resistance protein
MAKQEEKQKQIGVSVNLDTTPIFYTDNVFMTVNEDGVVLDFAQKIGTGEQIRIVSRIGMSREHAKKFIQKLSEIVAKSEGKVQTSNEVIN